MIILIAGASHTGKTALAQRLLEKYHFPYLSIDHLKMGLIRSDQTKLTPNQDNELTPYLWNIVKEIIKTAIENNQNLIVEGCYIPFNYKNYFSENYLNKIKFVCIIFSKSYIENNFNQIIQNANIIETRLKNNYITKEFLISENEHNLKMCKKYKINYILIDKSYNVNFEI